MKKLIGKIKSIGSQPDSSPPLLRRRQSLSDSTVEDAATPEPAKQAAAPVVPPIVPPNSNNQLTPKSKSRSSQKETASNPARKATDSDPSKKSTGFVRGTTSRYSAEAADSAKSPRISTSRETAKSPRRGSELGSPRGSARASIESPRGRFNSKENTPIAKHSLQRKLIAEPEFDAVAHVMALDEEHLQRVKRLGCKPAPYPNALAQLNSILSEPYFANLDTEAMWNLRSLLPKLKERKRKML